MSNVQNEWIIKDTDGDRIHIGVNARKVTIAVDNVGACGIAFLNLERLDYLIASLQEARELYKNVRRINK